MSSSMKAGSQDDTANLARLKADIEVALIWFPRR
jgi:hypothetical protein